MSIVLHAVLEAKVDLPARTNKDARTQVGLRLTEVRVKPRTDVYLVEEILGGDEKLPIVVELVINTGVANRICPIRSRRTFLRVTSTPQRSQIMPR